MSVDCRCREPEVRDLSLAVTAGSLTAIVERSSGVGLAVAHVTYVHPRADHLFLRCFGYYLFSESIFEDHCQESEGLECDMETKFN